MTSREKHLEWCKARAHELAAAMDALLAFRHGDRGHLTAEFARVLFDTLKSAPAGWKLVPVEPTEEMVIAGCIALDKAKDEIMAAMLSPERHAVGRTKMRIRYRAMLKSAPASPSPEDGQNGWRDDMENAPKEWRPTHQHQKGGLYRHIGPAQIQTDEPLTDYELVEVYQASDKTLWVRRRSEFRERFTPLPAPPSASKEGCITDTEIYPTHWQPDAVPK